MTEQPNEPEQTSSYEEPEEELRPRPRTVAVPTGRGPFGYTDYVDADPDVAWQWDCRTWGPIA